MAFQRESSCRVGVRDLLPFRRLRQIVERLVDGRIPRQLRMLAQARLIPDLLPAINRRR